MRKFPAYFLDNYKLDRQRLAQSYKAGNEPNNIVGCSRDIVMPFGAVVKHFFTEY